MMSFRFHKEAQTEPAWIIGENGETVYRTQPSEAPQRIDPDLAAVRRAALRCPDKPWIRNGAGAVSRAFIDAVAFQLGLEAKDIIGGKRNPRLVEARSIVCKLLRERDAMRYSYPAVARILGRSDHSTAINWDRQFPFYCKRNPDVWDTYKRLGGRLEYA